MKNKYFLLMLLSLAAAGLSYCHKDPNKTVIQGNITEYGTNAPIPGARIYLWCYNGEIFGPTGSSFIDSLVTDASGAFHTEYLDRDLCGGIYLSAFKEGFFYRSDIDIHSGVNDLEVVLDPEAWLKVVTVPGMDMGGISFSGTFTGAAGWSTYPNEGTQIYFFSTLGNRIKYIDWAYWSNPNATFKTDSIYLPGHDTTTYTIHY